MHHQVVRSPAAGQSEDLLLLACITAGAVIGFSLTGGAAVGTVLGAAAGIALLERHRQRAGRPRPRRS